MLFVLAGPSYVGKKTALSHFMKLYSFSSIIPYTTKPIKRQAGEVEGIKYHFVDPANAADIRNNHFIHDCPFKYRRQVDQVIYAYKKSDIEQAIDSYSNFIIHASVGNAINIAKTYKKENEGHLYIVFLNYDTNLTEDFFKDKFRKMDSLYQNSSEEIKFDKKQFERRYNHAKKEREVYSNNQDFFDEEIRGNQPYNICERLESYILPKLMVMPTSPDRIPGPLSDDDIVYMAEKRQKDKFTIRKDGNILSLEEVKERLSGCSVQLSLGDTIRVIKKPLIHNYIDMGQDEREIEAKLATVYVEKNISLGYVLKPNETILCSSAEQIFIPHDIYAIVSSRFSYTQLGLSIELGTSIIQPGHEGKVHFQIKNDTGNSICIYPEIQVVQLLLFRTVQPSFSMYRDNKGTHAYDSESISPISKFRKNNKELSEVKKPGMNLLKNIVEVLRNKIVETMVGVTTVVGIVLALATQVEKFLDKFILPLWYSSSVLTKCLLIAIAGSLFSNVFNFIGKVIFYLFCCAREIIRKKLR